MYIKDKVILVEDMPRIRQAIIEVIENELGWQVQIINTHSQILSSIETQSYFILDGVDSTIVNEIKNRNQNAFVSIFSADKPEQKLSEGFNADLFVQKTLNTKLDVRKMVVAMLQDKLKRIKSLEQEILQQLVNIDGESLPSDLDPNIQAYKDNIKDPDWFNQYNRKYVAFLNGKLVDSDLDRNALLERLSNNYPNQSCLCKQVSKKTRIIDIPSYDIV